MEVRVMLFVYGFCLPNRAWLSYASLTFCTERHPKAAQTWAVASLSMSSIIKCSSLFTHRSPAINAHFHSRTFPANSTAWVHNHMHRFPRFATCKEACFLRSESFSNVSLHQSLQAYVEGKLLGLENVETIQLQVRGREGA